MLNYFAHASQFTWVFVGLVTFLYLYLWYKRPSNFPPGPRGFPIIGIVPFMGKYPARNIQKWSRKYGAIMSVRVGSHDMVVLNDFQSVYQALVKQQSKFSGRPVVPLFEQLTDGFGLIFSRSEDFWKRQRKFGLMTLRGFGVGKRSMESRILEEISYMDEAIRSENGKPFNISNILQNVMGNNICSILFGKRFQYDDKRFQEITHKLMESFNHPLSNILNAILLFAPQLIRFPPFSIYNRRLKADVEDIFDMVEEIVKEHEDTFDDKDIRDFIDAFIVEMKKKEHSSFTRLQLRHYVRDLFVAGMDTSASTIYWSLLCLIHYPEAQRKVQNEIAELLGRNGMISMSKRADLPYTNAFIEEVFRFRTIAPLGVLHCADEDAELGGYVIPKGTMIAANLWAVHNDENVWEEPKKFHPERFLDEDGNFIRSNNAIPFSVGPRHCLGEQLARMEVFLIFVSLNQKFEFRPDPSADKLPDIEIGSSGILFFPRSYKLVAKEL